MQWFDNRSLHQSLLADGRPLLCLMSLGLILSGVFALFLSITGHFLPHDIAWLGMSVDELCAFAECRIVHFIFHDRVAFGGTLIALGILYLWLVEFPLGEGEAWAWWTLFLSGSVGFGSFLSYFGYGYLDKWHGVATLVLLFCFVVGMRRTADNFDTLSYPFRSVNRSEIPSWRTKAGLGKLLLLLVSLGLIGGGIVILALGTTRVFVPQDLAFIGMSRDEIAAISARLIPLIAHDRAGFGGATLSTGIAMLAIIWCGEPSRHRWQALTLAGSIGFLCAGGIHWAIGYTDLLHLSPVYLGFLLFLVGSVNTRLH